MKDKYLLVKGVNLKDEKISIVWRKDTTVPFVLEDNDTLDGLVYINGSNTIENALSLEDEFAKRMWVKNL